jgi:hypothetical protein
LLSNTRAGLLGHNYRFAQKVEKETKMLGVRVFVVPEIGWTKPQT